MLASKKSICPLTSKKPDVRTPLGSPLISLRSPCAAGGRIVIPSVPQLKVFDTSAQLLLPERRSHLFEQLQKSVCSALT